MQWWHWILIGFFFLGVEVAAPGGLFALFFGLSGLVVGALVGLGLIQADWLQWLLFTTLAIVALVALRRPLRARLTSWAPAKAIDSIVGDPALVIEDVGAGNTGKVEVRGSAWTARSAEPRVLAKGQRCRVERVDGLTLWVRPD